MSGGTHEASGGFEAVIREHEPILRDAIGRYMYTNIGGISPFTNERLEDLHWDLCADYSKRVAKFVRPVLVILTSKALGADAELALPTAVATECGQDWILVHDDILDGSVERRGEPALHIKYDTPLAINAGDAVHLLMWKVLADNLAVVGSEKGARIMHEFYRMLFRTMVGQTAELDLARGGRFDISEEEYFYVADSKTGYYTVAGPMRLGALVADDDVDRLEADVFPLFDDIGLLAGRAYQIIDDLLDLTSDFDGRKKQRGNDLYEGKRTLVLSHLMGVASDAERRDFHDILSRPREEKTPEEVERVIEAMRRHGSFDYARNRAEEFAERALARLDAVDFFVDSDAVAKLRSGIEFTVRRVF